MATRCWHLGRSAVPVQKVGEGTVLESPPEGANKTALPALTCAHPIAKVAHDRDPLTRLEVWWQKSVPSRAAAPPASYNRY